MAVLAKKMVAKKSKLDQLFDYLSIKEKMALFNLPPTLSYDDDRGKRMSVIWQSLSEEEKSSLWAKTFESENNIIFGTENIFNKIAANQ
jgi:hypothetical protein